MMEIAKIDNKYIENVDYVIQKLKYKYQVGMKGIKKELPCIESISKPKNSKGIFSIKVYAANNEQGKKYLKDVISYISNESKEKIDIYINTQKELIKLIDKDIQREKDTLTVLQKEILKYKTKVPDIEKANPSLAAIYSIEILQKEAQLQEIRKRLSQLKNKKEQLRISISPFKIESTKMVGDITTFDKPVKPKKALIIVVSLITGLIFGVFLVFFIEFIKSLKEEEDKETTTAS